MTGPCGPHGVEERIPLSDDAIQVWKRRDVSDRRGGIVCHDGEPQTEFCEPHGDGVHVDAEEALFEHLPPEAQPPIGLATFALEREPDLGENFQCAQEKCPRAHRGIQNAETSHGHRGTRPVALLHLFSFDDGAGDFLRQTTDATQSGR
jgi:hypothetical protein